MSEQTDKVEEAAQISNNVISSWNATITDAAQAADVPVPAGYSNAAFGFDVFLSAIEIGAATFAAGDRRDWAMETHRQP